MMNSTGLLLYFDRELMARQREIVVSRLGRCIPWGRQISYLDGESVSGIIHASQGGVLRVGTNLQASEYSSILMMKA